MILPLFQVTCLEEIFYKPDKAVIVDFLSED